MHKTGTLLSAVEAAERLGIGRRAVIDLIRTKELHAHKLPGRTGSYVLDPAEVERYRAARDEAPSGEARSA